MADTQTSFEWTELDQRAVDTARVLAMDAVQKVGNGHPGTAMSLAPAAYLLFQRFLRHDPTDPAWTGRDRFVLSCGHTSLTLYVQLYLSGYGLELDDLRSLRTWGSLTPGHPEHGHTAGVEVTTGPLGQGVANAVGMAMAARRERGLFDPDAAPGDSPFDHTIWAFASDGDIQEGVSSEASSLAGTQRLGNLVLLYDDNHISIEDDTVIALSEDVDARYAAYGWHVQRVNWLDDSGSYDENVAALAAAFEAARAERDRPSFIALRTIIGWPAPNAQNTGKAHGSALGDEEVQATKKILGFNPSNVFDVDPEVLAHARQVVQRGRDAHAQWIEQYNSWAEGNAEAKALHDRMSTRSLPDGWTSALPEFPADEKGVATRKASGETIAKFFPKVPTFIGGSADLDPSTNTAMK
ncbi:MAG: transketolase, partial [Chloroflexota bacterium]|nr:transketolase [Chloroflexota bacterium]